jgi:hypothetical protein
VDRVGVRKRVDRGGQPLAGIRQPRDGRSARWSCSSLSVSLAAAGAWVAWCLLVLALAPWVTVLGYELRGHRHNEEVLANL